MLMLMRMLVLVPALVLVLMSAMLLLILTPGIFKKELKPRDRITFEKYCYSLYSEDQLQEYSQLIPAEGPPAPHAFEMAARAYTKMMAQACTQPRATGLRQTAS